MRETALIVGGTGFIGRYLVADLVEKGIQCSILSLRSVPVRQFIDQVDYIQSDLTDLKHLTEALSKRSFDYVINLSGYIDHSAFFDGGREVVDVHFVGVQNLLQALNRVAIKRFVQVGSSDEYGNLPAPQRESMREAPISPYSLAKVASTQLLQMLHRTEGFPAVIMRFFLVYGEGQDNKRFLPQIIQGCLEDRQFPSSEGEQLRDFCHVADISRGIIAALKVEQALGEVINLASGQPVSIRTMIEKVREQVGKGEPQFGKIAYRPGESMSLYADVNKAVQLLGWQPDIELDEGLRRTIQFYIGESR